MNKLWIGIGLFSFTFISAQIDKKPAVSPNRSIIDSINHNRWQENTVSLDSISAIKLVDIPKVKAETKLIQEDKIQPTEVTEPVPVTPYQIMNTPSERRWFIFGKNNVTFNQSSFSNWNPGGTNSFGINAKVNYTFVYKKNRHFLENNIQLGYGMVSSSGQSSRKTDDVINIFSNYGYDLGKNYYLSAGIQFLSQFSPGYNYNNTPDPTYDDRVSKFMAPGYLNVGAGISFNPKENFQIIFRPATGRFTFVLDPHLQKAGSYGLERDGQSVRTEFGALANILYKLEIMKGLSFTNQLNLFSSYASHPERVDISYTGTVNIKFNKFITTMITMDLLYDHDQLQRLQMKQTLGVGFSYDLGIQSKDRPDTKKLIKPFANSTSVKG
ncbi:DUF3078 domain-containing protein [Elizabethkingia sp. JS20170427COW]|uniref:DUF3078 domain-containing protein n=1 Tax=Elizabethkingia sp. JS20170427COW TaxID=2583851 RepID=UPI0011102BBD|nr:DUF3078 domain-containing protein [Elizabethkingia sp. JS20170427COW]QCX53007.1 DUF3078 domain-containing protein [Elizabethkingia sp. JS20170427COW]